MRPFVRSTWQCSDTFAGLGMHPIQRASDLEDSTYSTHMPRDWVIWDINNMVWQGKTR